MVLLFLAAIAGQDTTCTKVGATVNCHQEQSGLTDYGALLRSGAASVPRYDPGPQPDPSLQLRRQVGKLVAKGDCAGAEKAALEGGDLDLATRAREYCAHR